MTSMESPSSDFLFRKLHARRKANLDGIIVTPRDLRDFSAEVASGDRYLDDFRYKGYPLGKFESPRSKITGNLASDSLDKYFGLPNHKNAPPRVPDNPIGLQYGSDGLPIDTAAPRPIKDPFNDKTSAEARRVQVQHQEIDQELSEIRALRQARMDAQQAEKKQDMALLKSYNPWGKPGAGAPQVTVPYQKFDTEADAQKVAPNSGQKRLFEEYGDFHSQFGKPGNGAPLKTTSGKLKTELKQDPNIRSEATLNGIPNALERERYRADFTDKKVYKEDLDTQIQQRYKSLSKEKEMDAKKDIEMLQYDPYTKPSDRKGMGRSQRKDDASRGGPAEEVYDPWGKGVGQPERDELGDVKRHMNMTPSVGVGEMVFREKRNQPASQPDPMHPQSKSIEFGFRGGAGAPVISDSGNVRTRMPATLGRNEQGDSLIREEYQGRTSQQRNSRNSNHNSRHYDDPELGIYDPWGKDGAGAPRRDSNGNVQTNVFGRMKHEVLFADNGQATNDRTNEKQRAARQEYLSSLKNDMEEQKKRKEVNDATLKYGGGELATVMNNGQVGKPRRDPNTGMLADQHLGTSDITKEQTGTRPQKTDQSPYYHTELERAAEDRKRASQLEKLKGQQESRQHQSTMDRFWGRPGAGAPKNTTKMSKLDDILQNTPRERFDPTYEKKYPTGEDPYNKVKSTIPSTHVNMYELDQPQRREAKKDYQLFTPFATDPNEVY